MTRVLGLMGGTLPRKLKRGSAVNPPGFWEGRRIVRLHEELLGSLGSSWDDIGDLPADWLRRKCTQEHEDALLEVLVEDFPEAPVAVVKDPRLSRLAPLWLRLLQRFQAEPGFVIMIRHPLEVARSLAARDGFGQEKSLLLWLVHLVEAERHSRGSPRVFVAYDQLLDEPGTVEGRVRDGLGVEWPEPRGSRLDEIRRFLSDEHRHHVAEADDPREGTDLHDCARAAYDVARQASRGDGFDGDRTAQAAFDEVARHVRRAQLAALRRAAEVAGTPVG
jgi:hypothetical protein